ncbi:hypothetical protein [Heliorestis convoluta]|nr:hypothetical protein [Heliorestis convoluta]
MVILIGPIRLRLLRALLFPRRLVRRRRPLVSLLEDGVEEQ